MQVVTGVGCLPFRSRAGAGQVALGIHNSAR
jgi:hypothetical protein